MTPAQRTRLGPYREEYKRLTAKVQAVIDEEAAQHRRQIRFAAPDIALALHTQKRLRPLENEMRGLLAAAVKVMCLEYAGFVIEKPVPPGALDEMLDWFSR